MKPLSHIHLVGPDPERPATVIARLTAQAREQSAAELTAWLDRLATEQASTEKLSTLDLPAGIRDRLRRFAETIRVEVLAVAVLKGRS